MVRIAGEQPSRVVPSAQRLFTTRHPLSAIHFSAVTSYLLIALGSALGGVARHWCAVTIANRFGNTFPWGTLAVNVVGSFLIGLIAAFAAPHGRWGESQTAREFLMVGVLGGYTTFSAFSLQTLTLLRDGKVAYASANIALSVLLCLIAVWLGYALGSALKPAPAL